MVLVRGRPEGQRERLEDVTLLAGSEDEERSHESRKVSIL